MNSLKMKLPQKKLPYIFILVFSLLFFVTLLLFIKLNRQFSKTMIQSYHKDQLYLIKTVATGMQQIINQINRELTHLSVLEELRQKNPKAYIHQFQDFYRFFAGRINSISKINTQGKIEYVYPYSEEYINKDMNHLQCVRDVFHTKELTISKCFTTEVGVYVLAINRPILFQEGKEKPLKGVIRCVIHLDTFTNLFRPIINLQEEGEIWMIDQDGMIIYHPDPQFNLKNYGNIVETKGLEQTKNIQANNVKTPYHYIKKGIESWGIYPFWGGNDELYAMTPLKIGAKIWSVGITTPYAFLYQPIKRNNHIMWFLTITLLTIFSLGGFILHYVNKKKTLLEAETKLLEADTKFLKKKVELEEEIKKERDKLNILFESMADAVLVINSNHQVEFMNQTAITTFGQQIGRRCFEVLRDYERPCDSCQLAENEKFPMEPTRFYCQDHRTKRWYEINAAPLQKDEQKKYLIAILRDVTKEKELEEKLKTSEKKYRTLINYTDDLIMMQDYSGTVIYGSQSVEKILGFVPDEIFHRPFQSLLTENPINDPWRKEIKSQADAQRRLQPHLLECKTKHGDKIILEANESIVFDSEGQENRIMGVYRDITERKRLEEQLLESERLRILSLTKRFSYGELIGKNSKMQEIYELIEAVSQSKATVLILGKSGTGKELVARAIHYQGPLSKGPFIGVNCAALSENLLESELFGHVKGSFTGAIKNKSGRFELADGGTLFLDEIGDISLNVQTKLLRVLQEQKFERVGGEKTIRVEVRIIVATNKDLYEEVQKGKFREDLYYRLNVVEITLPLLIERIDDLPLLITHFIEKFNHQTGKKITGVSRETMKILSHYPWPGNVRELEHVIEHAFVKCVKDIIHHVHLPRSIAETKTEGIIQEGIKKGHIKDQIEKDILLKTLEECNWNFPLVTQKLDISRATLWRRMKKYGMSTKNL